MHRSGDASFKEVLSVGHEQIEPTPALAFYEQGPVSESRGSLPFDDFVGLQATEQGSAARARLTRYQTINASDFLANSAADQTTDRRLTVTVFSVFLGAGKTTVLNHLFNNREGLRLALIVNDRSDVDIAASLVTDAP